MATSKFEKRGNVLLCSNTESILTHELNRSFNLTLSNSISISNVLRTEMIHCIVFFANHEVDGIKTIKKNFRNIPIVVILEDNDLETARLLGKWGIERVMGTKNIRTIRKELDYIIAQKQNNMTLGEIGIDASQYNSVLLRKCLDLMEKMYVELKTVGTISEMLNVSEPVLIREFQKYNLLSPKKIILLLKVMHAEKLMINSGLNIKEICHLSGFTNVKRMSECFHRIFGRAPGVHRINLLSKGEITE